MGFGAVETLGQLTLGDVGNEADMGPRGVQVLVHIEGGEIAAIPGSAEQWREVPFGALQRIEDGGELLGEGEETAVGGGLLIAQSVDEAAGGEASAGDAGGEPRAIHFSEEAGDLAPTGALAGLAGITYQDDEEVETVAGGVDHAVGSAADEVAKGGQQLEKNGGRMGFGVRSDGTHGEPGETMQGGFAQCGVRGSLGRRERWLRRRIWPGCWIWIGFGRLGLRLGWEIEQLSSALSHARESGKGRAHYAVVRIS
jgi:hypothetical protein